MSEQEQHQYKFDITMNCRGCSGAVERVLKKLEGVQSYQVDLESQSATVTAEPSLSYEKVLETIKKTNKIVKAGEADGISMSV
ncbi:hypothetical protein V8E54_004484 [Elaphomyces granulatus]|jgi:copper chaperone|uniref:HMA domain-containing protein n=1 Tax=Elaphomyces granulatus TaxID=519963 RepID=A0A232LQR5_9EURO|nr:hypothetical protein Egran_05732 [Elaphomyces granulatus]